MSFYGRATQVTQSPYGRTGMTEVRNIGNPGVDYQDTIITLPFDIIFLGTNYSSIKISSDGYFLFGSSMSDLLRFFSRDGVNNYLGYKVTNDYPNRLFIIRYEGDAYPNSLSSVRGIICELVFYENNNRIDINYISSRSTNNFTNFPFSLRKNSTYICQWTPTFNSNDPYNTTYAVALEWSNQPLTDVPLPTTVGVLAQAPISNICFPAGTPINTDQGLIPIEQINSDICSIRGNKIETITKTITQDKYLICIEKDALAKNIPSQKTIISKNHGLLYNGEMIKARELLELNNEGIYKVKYNGTLLYNILLQDKHDKMIVNNLICETLDPKNGIARMYLDLKNYNDKEKQEFIKEYNEYIKQNKTFAIKK
jgi:hypothetical protein